MANIDEVVLSLFKDVPSMHFFHQKLQDSCNLTNKIKKTEIFKQKSII